MKCFTNKHFTPNSQVQDLDSHLGQVVYIKYFILLKENYYVAINSKASGPFDLSPKIDVSIEPEAK